MGTMAWYSGVGIVGCRLRLLHMIGFWDRLLAGPVDRDVKV